MAGARQLIASIASAPGTDPYGNAYPAGLGGLSNNTQYKQKPVDENLVSSITMQNDDHLFVPLAANATYKVEFHVQCKSPNNGLQTSWATPTGTTGAKMCTGPTSVVADGSNRGDTKMRLQGSTTLNTAITYAVDPASSTVIRETGLITTGSTAGNLQLQWAQITSSATAATMFAGSYLVVERIA
jgi:hypothetical protein